MSDLPSTALGWRPDLEAPARAAWASQGQPPLFSSTVFADDERPLPPAFTLADQVKFWFNQGPVGSCLPPGTRIRRADGSSRPIEQTRLLDEVVTAEGNTGVVKHLMVRFVDERIIKIRIWGHGHLSMTGEHPVLTKRGYVKAEDLQLDDFVAMPRYLCHRNTILQTADHVALSRRTVNRDRRLSWYGIQGRPGLAVTCKAIPDVIHLTPGAGRIFGLFLAEGNTDSGKVTWTFADDEEQTLVAELVRTLAEEWGVEAHVAPKPSQHSIKVVVYGTPWARLFESLCSTGAGNKDVHPDLMGGPIEFQEAMFRGWMDGDGHYRDTGYAGVTISRSLANNMFDIAQGLGLRPAFRSIEPQVNRYAARRVRAWEVAVRAKGDNWRNEMDDDHAWRKVKGLDEEDYKGPVFNIEVEGDNSYVAEGIGVHNCFANAGTSSIQINRSFEVASGNDLPEVQLSRAMVWYGCRVFDGSFPSRSDGGSITNTLRALHEYGVCLESTLPYKPDHEWLERKPPQSAFDESKLYRITGTAELDFGKPDDIKRMIFNGHPPVIGIWWCYGWDGDRIDSTGTVTGVGPGTFGHALPIIGWDGDTWHILNSHGPIYPVLPVAKSSKIPGYASARPTRCYSFWCPDKYLQQVVSHGNAEIVAPAGVTGFSIKVPTSWELAAS